MIRQLAASRAGSSPRLALLVGLMSWLVFFAIEAHAQLLETVSVITPGVITFDVRDLTQPTIATGSPHTVSFDQAQLPANKGLRIQVRAETADFIAPAPPSIPATSVSWTATGAVGGTGVNGVLSRNQFRTVYESQSGVTSGRVDLRWTLAAVSKNVRVGTHTLTVRWNFESFAR